MNCDCCGRPANPAYRSQDDCLTLCRRCYKDCQDSETCKHEDD